MWRRCRADRRPGAQGVRRFPVEDCAPSASPINRTDTAGIAKIVRFHVTASYLFFYPNRFVLHPNPYPCMNQAASKHPLPHRPTHPKSPSPPCSPSGRCPTSSPPPHPPTRPTRGRAGGGGGGSGG